MDTKKLQLIVVMGWCTGIAIAIQKNATIAMDETRNAEQILKTKKGKAKNSAKRNKISKKTKPKVKIFVTIDGGSATKKSPIAKNLSEKFNLIYFKSGAFFRTIAYVLDKHQLEPKIENKEEIETFLKNIEWKIFIIRGHVCFFIDGEILSDKELRSEKLNETVALYASQFEGAHQLFLKTAQEVINLVEKEDFDGLIAEGRTCGTQAFTQADLKFWLNANDEQKINFRKNQEKQIDDPLKRDALDRACKFSSFKKAKNAILIWPYNRSEKQNISLISSFIQQKIDEKSELLTLNEQQNSQ